jgi:hypothetical protein
MSGIHLRAPGYAGTCRTGPPASTNSMVVFGTGVDCYFSHRPKYLAPYDFQVLLDVELDEPGKRALGADRRAGYRGIHSFVTADFPVAELDPECERPRTVFCGNLIRGTAETGAIIAEDIEATVRTVLAHAELDPCTLRGRGLVTHLCFGRAGRLYLAHRIGRRPSFDQIVAVRLLPGSVTDMAGTPLPDDDVGQLALDTAQPIILGRHALTRQRLRAGEVAVAAFHATESVSGTHGFLVDVEVQRQIYLEAADLT